jgi:Ca2+-binding EF-hand superfamily protein
MRLGPHFSLTFVFLEQMKRFARNYYREQHEKQHFQQLFTLFKQYDLDGNGKLDISEVKEQFNEKCERSVVLSFDFSIQK